ncbi:MAG: ATP-binding protein [Bryobacteraceae bacterium]|jgi:signal transduction histidine kinase
MMRSLRSRLLVASLLWTSGLLAMMHMVTMTLIHVFPRMRGFHAVGMTISGILFMSGGVLVAFRALAPLRGLRGKLAAVRSLQTRTIEGVYPSEIRPLVEDLNALIEDRETALKRAVATAGDLAHGLKTPLAVLSQEADRVASAGNGELAGRITQQVERMLRQVNYHLARARAAPGVTGAPPCPVAPCAAGVVRTLLKLHAARELGLSSTIEPGLYALVRREDLEEILGNLLDNACKWAKSRVALNACRVESMLVVTVDDDGPGLAPDRRSVALERGVRLDEAAPGSGLGLSIVRDLAEMYFGSICLEDSPLGGLRARMTVPAFAEAGPLTIGEG